MTLENITIPTPAPYDSDDPLQQTENLCYVILQVLQKIQTAQLDIDVVDAIKALSFNGQEVDFGTFRVRFDGKTASIG